MRSPAHTTARSRALVLGLFGLLSTASSSLGSLASLASLPSLSSLTSLVSVAGVGVGLVGCTRRYAAYPANAKDTTERLVQAHAAITQLRANPFAIEATLDINRADSLLLAAEKRSADPDTVDEFLDLLLSTVEGQLVQVNTDYARRKAETTLDARRAAAGAGDEPVRDRADARPSMRTNP